MAGVVLRRDRARAARRAASPLLSLAVIVLLVVDPWLARDYGFALSAAATAGLLLARRPARRGLSRA